MVGGQVNEWTEEEREDGKKRGGKGGKKEQPDSNSIGI